MLHRVLFGDNQFFGINHLSEEKARDLAERFRSLESIIEVCDYAYNAGIRAFFLNTNERAVEICNHFRENKEKYSGLAFYPSIPYAYKYANAVSEKGIFGALKDAIAAGSSSTGLVDLLAKGSMSLFERDMVKVMEILVDMELSMFEGLEMKAIFLQNTVVDLLLGIGVEEPFLAFSEHVKKTYDVEAGFVTLNLPHMVEYMDKIGIDNPILCSTINKIGFNMNPGLDAYERTIANGGFRPIAMSVLASGAVAPDDAISYVCEQKQIESILFGASSQRNIIQTKQLVDQYS